MGWPGKGDEERYVPEYRISECDGGFEPQMQYQVGHVDRWYALLPSGIMADPGVWSMGSTGESYVHVILPNRAMAERAILRAKTINGQNPLTRIAAPQPS
jgi:hypothetical protein